LKILVRDPDDGLTTDIDRVSQDPLDAAKQRVDEEVGLESLWRLTPLPDIISKISSEVISPM
jgi:hypothetical protein